MSLSLYIHIPFCKTKCSYCAFNTYENSEYLIEPFVNALINEIRVFRQSSERHVVHTVFFGGGTPSLLTASHFEHVFHSISDSFSLTSDAEISLEANPDDLSTEYLAALRSVGFNRISIGMQSSNRRDLDLFLRRHDMNTVTRAVNSLQKAGFSNFNLDLIYGTPYQTIDEWQDSLQSAIDLEPTHLSLYGLELKGGTGLRIDVDSGKIPRPDDDLTADMYDLATDFLADKNYEQYEISNWSRDGYKARHNLQYWHNLHYLGIGPGAHGFAGGLRYSTITLPSRYIEALNKPSVGLKFPTTPAVAKSTPVTRETEMFDTIMMGLRLTQEGINRANFRERFGSDLYDLKRDAIDRFVKLGVLYADKTTIRLTRQGRFVSNAIIGELV